MREKFDIAIIGGGTVGSMLFYDACLRGYSTVLIEKGRLGMQTNYASLGFAQAGANYLLKDREMVFMNAVDCGLLKDIAGDFVKPLRIVLPVFPGSKFPLWLWDGFFSAFDKIAKPTIPSRHTRWSKEQLLEEEPHLKKTVHGAVVYRERIFNPVEFVQTIVKQGCRMGGVVLEDTRTLTSYMTTEGEVKKLHSIYTRFGDEETWVDAKVFINATGPWAPGVLERVFRVPPFETRMTRGTSVIVGKRFSNSAMVVFDDDDKYITILPLSGRRTLVGPTNSDIDPEVAKDPDKLKPRIDDTTKLLKTATKYFNVELGCRDIVEVKCGLRPQLNHRKVKPNNITHEFMVVDHEERDEVSNLITVFGGKLSNQVRMAKETLELAGRKLGTIKMWTVPDFKITKTGMTERKISQRDRIKLMERYGRKLALTYQDDVNRVALQKRIKATVYLFPFLVAGFIKGFLFKRRRDKNGKKSDRTA